MSAITLQMVSPAPEPVVTAAGLLAEWFRQQGGPPPAITGYPAPAEAPGLKIIVGTLSQPQLRARILECGLPVDIQLDGYVLARQADELFIYSPEPRGVVYACGYEWPRCARWSDGQLGLDSDLIRREPLDALRGWCTGVGDYDFWPHAAAKYRMNMAWMEAPVAQEVSLAADPKLAPYLAPYAPEIGQRRAATQKGIALGKKYGLETFAGGGNALWQLPVYLFEALIQSYPETLAQGYQASSDWPPFEWQDRPQLCFSSPVTKALYTAILEEFMQAHPELDGLCLGLGYDLYPFGCGCEQCRRVSYHDRFREQMQLAYEVAIAGHHKKLWVWTWITGGSSAIPGYDHYYGWAKAFAQAHPDSVILTSFATEGDFNLTHRPNPVIGRRGPQDMGVVLLWPEYRGDGVLPSWLVDWMVVNLPVLRAQGASGFMGADVA